MIVVTDVNGHTSCSRAKNTLLSNLRLAFMCVTTRCVRASEWCESLDVQLLLHLLTSRPCQIPPDLSVAIICLGQSDAGVEDRYTVDGFLADEQRFMSISLG